MEKATQLLCGKCVAFVRVARTFKRGRAGSVLPLLESMAALGLAARSGDGAYRSTG